MTETKPHYYKAGSKDVIAFCFHHSLDFATGNVVKYVVRAGKKGDRLTDLLKAREYLDRLIAQTQEKEEESLSNPPIY
jgi:hypothetical protein